MKDKSILTEIKSFEYDRNRSHIFGIKSAIVWGHSQNTTVFPLLYISKPKNITKEQFEELLNCIDINFVKKPCIEE